jgi:hypothetical protein
VSFSCTCFAIDPHLASELLSDLRPVKAAYHDAYDLTGVSQPCMQGTRVQLLEEIKQWVMDTNSTESRVFWLNGLAGTGKTSVARSVAAWGQERGILGATFFFSRDSLERRDPVSVIPTIAYQLAKYISTVKRAICDSMSSQQDIREKGITDQAKVLLQCLQADIVPSSTLLLLVFDALDEQMSHNDNPIGHIIQHLCSLPFSTRIFVTSRDQPKIEAMLSRNNALRLRIHQIKDSTVQQDIRTYFERSFDRLADERNLDKPYPSDEDIGKLVKVAGTLFIYAATIFRWVADENWTPDVRLKEILRRDAADAADQHGSLDDMYLRILRAAADTSRGLQHVQLLSTTIAVLVYAQEPIPASMLADVVAVHVGKPTVAERIKSYLQQLSAVLVSEGDAPIRFFHPSFPEFFQNPERCNDRRFETTATSVHMAMAKHCVRVLNAELHMNMCDLTDASVANDQVHDLTLRLEQATTSRLRYACKYWPYHLREADGIDEAMLSCLKIFCTTHLLHWFEMLSLTGGWTVLSKELRPLVNRVRLLAKFFVLDLCTKHVVLARKEFRSCRYSASTQGRFADVCRLSPTSANACTSCVPQRIGNDANVRTFASVWAGDTGHTCVNIGAS